MIWGSFILYRSGYVYASEGELRTFLLIFQRKVEVKDRQAVDFGKK